MYLKKPKKINKTAWKRKCDKLFSQKIRKLGYCQLKGKDKIKCGGGLQVMHIETRGNLRLRWNPINVLCGCAGHHYYYTNHPLDFIEVIQEWFPHDWDYVMKHRKEIATSINYPALYKMIQEWKLYELS